MDELQQLRAEIDSIDAEMAALFCRRMAAAKKAALYKQAAGLPLQDAQREAAILETHTPAIQPPALRPFYGEFLTHLLGLSRKYQAAGTAGEQP